MMMAHFHSNTTIPGWPATSRISVLLCLKVNKCSIQNFYSHSFTTCLNSRIHIDDKDFALDDGLLPANVAQGKIGTQFSKLAELAGIGEKIFNDMMVLMLSASKMAPTAMVLMPTSLRI